MSIPTQLFANFALVLTFLLALLVKLSQAVEDEVERYEVSARVHVQLVREETTQQRAFSSPHGPCMRVCSSARWQMRLCMHTSLS